MCLTDMPAFRQSLAESRVLREIGTLILFTWNFCIYAATSYGQTFFLLYFYMNFCCGLSGYICVGLKQDKSFAQTHENTDINTNTCTTSMSLIKIYLKFLKNTPACFGHSTIIREIFSSSLKSLLSTTLWIFLY